MRRGAIYCVLHFGPDKSGPYKSLTILHPLPKAGRGGCSIQKPPALFTQPHLLPPAGWSSAAWGQAPDDSVVGRLPWNIDVAVGKDQQQPWWSCVQFGHEWPDIRAASAVAGPVFELVELAFVQHGSFGNSGVELQHFQLHAFEGAEDVFQLAKEERQFAQATAAAVQSHSDLEGSGAVAWQVEATAQVASGGWQPLSAAARGLVEVFGQYLLPGHCAFAQSLYQGVEMAGQAALVSVVLLGGGDEPPLPGIGVFGRDLSRSKVGVHHLP